MREDGDVTHDFLARVSANEYHFCAILHWPRLRQQGREWRSRPFRVPHGAGKEWQPAITRAFNGASGFLARQRLQLRQREFERLFDQSGDLQ